VSKVSVGLGVGPPISATTLRSAATPDGPSPDGTDGSSLRSNAAASRARLAERERARADRQERLAARPRRRRSDEELQEVVRRGQAELAGSGVGAADEAGAKEVVAWAAAEFGDSLAVASSMKDAVVPFLVSQELPWVDVLFGETSYHFAETLGTRDLVAHELDVTVVDVRPELSVAEQDAAYGKDLFARDPEACCRMRKVEPMRRALAGYEAWATGLRRADSAGRREAPLISWDAANGLVKINPLAGWSDDDLVSFALRHRLPANPLLAEGYPSIGCAPCTRAVAPGEDPRAGRWAGLEKSECGLHG